MFKQVVSIFLNSHAESLKLEERYRSMTTRLGWVTVAMGCAAMIPLMYFAWLMFGLPLEGGSIEGLRLNLISWIVLVVLLLPIAFYVGMVLVYGLAGLILFAFRKLTAQQALELACYARYPKAWYDQTGSTRTSS